MFGPPIHDLVLEEDVLVAVKNEAMAFFVFFLDVQTMVLNIGPY